MRPLFPSALLALVATAAFADTYEAPMRDYVSQDVKAWLSDPQIVSAVRGRTAPMPRCRPTTSRRST